jgi:hypothetical protein
MNALTDRQLKLAILSALRLNGKQHRSSLVGRPDLPGLVEHHLRTKFEPAQRQQTDLAFIDLLREGLIQSTFDDLLEPTNWVVLADAGRQALERRALDPLDEALGRISAGLVEMRAGAWSAVASGRPDSLRQAAHSARELIDQTLKEGAPDDAVRLAPGFVPDKTSKNGVTRRHRLRYLMIKHAGDASETALREVEAACELVLAANASLLSAAHARAAPLQEDVRRSLQAAEIALRRLLQPR